MHCLVLNCWIHLQVGWWVPHPAVGFRDEIEHAGADQEARLRACIASGEHICASGVNMQREG